MNDKPFNKFTFDDLGDIVTQRRDCQWDIDAAIDALFVCDDGDDDAVILNQITELQDKLRLLNQIRVIMEDDLGIND